MFACAAGAVVAVVAALKAHHSCNQLITMNGCQALAHLALNHPANQVRLNYDAPETQTQVEAGGK
jgi:hypothetical protein